ncbi:hypothetical protein [Leptolyngbya sp. AN10]
MGNTISQLQAVTAEARSEMTVFFPTQYGLSAGAFFGGQCI